MNPSASVEFDPVLSSQGATARLMLAQLDFFSLRTEQRYLASRVTGLESSVQQASSDALIGLFVGGIALGCLYLAFGQIRDLEAVVSELQAKVSSLSTSSTTGA